MPSIARGNMVWGLALLPAFAAVVGLRAIRNARAMLKPDRVALTDEQVREAHARLPGLVDIELRTTDALTLRCWFMPGPARDAVVLVHGLYQNRAQLIPEAAILARRGHGVLLLEPRGNGDSDGEGVTWGDKERLDVEAALDYLQSRADVDAGRVGLYGFSCGATPVALIGATDPRVRAVALGPTWTSLEDELRDKFKKWGPLSILPAHWLFRRAGIDFAALRPIDVIHRIPPRALFLFSGAEDTDTPPTVMARLHQKVPQAERWLIPGAGHGGYESVVPEEFERRFGGFFDVALAPHPR